MWLFASGQGGFSGPTTLKKITYVCLPLAGLLVLTTPPPLLMGEPF